MVKEGMLEIKGIRMRYIAFGRGQKSLVMIQGLNTGDIRGMSLPLAWMYRIFGRDYRVYLFDRREALPEEITVRELASDIAAAMDHLGLADAHIFGVSQGGMIAQYLAIDRPDLVQKLVLAVTLSRNNETVRSVIESWVEMTRQNRIRELVADMAQKMYSDAYIHRYRPFLPLLTLAQKPKDVPRFLTLARACLSCDAYGELEKIQCPVFVIGGEKDRIVGAEASREIARKLGCEIYLYPDLGHAAYEEAADFNERVIRFLRN